MFLVCILKKRRNVKICTDMRNEMDHMNPEPVPRATGFMERLVSSNALGDIEFDEWVFHPGMLFNALDKWWGNQEYRETTRRSRSMLVHDQR